MTGLDPIRNNSSSQLTGVNHEAKPAQADGRRDKGVRALLSKVADRIFNNGGVREKVFESLKKHSGKVLDVLKDAPKGLGKLGTKVATALKGVKNLFSTADSKTNTQRQVGFNSPSLSRSQSFGSVSQNPIGQNVADGRAKLGRMESVYEEMPPFDSNPNAMDAQEVKKLDDQILLCTALLAFEKYNPETRTKHAKKLAEIAANPDAPSAITSQARRVIRESKLEGLLTQEEQEKAGVGRHNMTKELREAAVISDEGEADGAEVKSPRESIDANGEGLEEVSEDVEPNKPSDAGEINLDDVLKNLGNLSQEDFEPKKPSDADQKNMDDVLKNLGKLSQEGMEKSETSDIERPNSAEVPFAESRKNAEPNQPSDAAKKSVNSMEQEMQGLFDFINNKPNEDKSLNGQVSGDVESDELFEDAGAEIDEDVQTTTQELVWTEVPKFDKSAEASKADKAEINKEDESQSAPLSEEVKSSKPTEADKPKLSEKAKELLVELSVANEKSPLDQKKYNKLNDIIKKIVKDIEDDAAANNKDDAYAHELIRNEVISTQAFQRMKNFELNNNDSSSGYAYSLIRETKVDKSSKPTEADEPKLSEEAQKLSDMLSEAVKRIEKERKGFNEVHYNELKLIIDELVKQVRVDNAGYRDPAYVNEQIRDNVISTKAFQYIKNFEVNNTDFNKASPSGYAFDLINETR